MKILILLFQLISASGNIWILEIEPKQTGNMTEILCGVKYIQVHGYWASWQDWSECVTDVNTGTFSRVRRRSCICNDCHVYCGTRRLETEICQKEIRYYDPTIYDLPKTTTTTSTTTTAMTTMIITTTTASKDTTTTLSSISSTISTNMITITLSSELKYRVIQENSECANGIGHLLSNVLVPLQECFSLAQKSELCPVNVVEWGSNEEMKPDELGVCKCWSKECDYNNLRSDDEEHMIEFFVETKDKIELDTTKTTTQCIDNNTDCPKLAEMGACDFHPEYMLTSCKLSCDNCDTSETNQK